MRERITGLEAELAARDRVVTRLERAARAAQPRASQLEQTVEITTKRYAAALAKDEAEIGRLPAVMVDGDREIMDTTTGRKETAPSRPLW